MGDFPELPSMDHPPAAPGVSPAPGPAPVQTASPVAPATAAEPIEVVETSVEEVLEQASALTLRISHVEDVVSGTERVVADLREEMLAGLTGLRATIVEQAAPAAGLAGGASTEGVASRLEALEEQVQRSGRRQGVLLGVLLLQLALLVVLLASQYVRKRKELDLPPPSYLAPATTASQPETVQRSLPPPVTEDSKKPAKKRHKR